MDSSGETKRGSEWHRWDPHLHAPGTLLSDQFDNDWDGYIDRIEKAQPTVRAIGATDYFCIQSYRRFRDCKRSGRLRDVALIFPNVEMRLTVETEQRRGINVHLLFAPDEEGHEDQIERILAQLTFDFRGSLYSCRLEEFERLGKAVEPNQQDKKAAIRAGANQFKVTLKQLKDLFRGEAWLARNCLVGMAAAEGDGTSGLQKDASFLALREEIEAFAHIIFSGKPGDREYWLGRRKGVGREEIERRYGALKPCLHGSDAHRMERVLAPDLDRACWVKAELTFEGLRQAVIEPETRVSIGKDAPLAGASHERIAAVRVSNAPWFTSGRVALNPGLVAIIGARGSGKTALADMLASAAGAVSEKAGDASFIQRASHPENLLVGSSVSLDWQDGDHVERELAAWDDDDPFTERPRPRVRYLSQQFVEQLCAADGLARDLLAEIEGVVFEAVDETERLGATNFSELRDLHVQPLRVRGGELRDEIETCSQQIAGEDAAHERVGGLREKHKGIVARLMAARQELEKVVPKGQDVRARRFAELDAACIAAEAQVQQLRLVRQKVDELRAEADRIGRENVTRLEDLKRRFVVLGIIEDDWRRFELRFAGDVRGVLDLRAQTFDREVSMRMDGDPNVALDTSGTPKPEWPVHVLRKQREDLRTAVGADAAKAKRVAELTKEIALQEAESKKLEQIIARDAEYEDRRKALVQARRAAYANIFDVLRDEQLVLEKLYGPLARRLSPSSGTPSRLRFAVRRRVDLDAWVRAGENLLDLRTAGALRGRGAIKEAAVGLVQAWRSGGAEEVASALQEFLTRHWQDLRQGRPDRLSAEDAARWFVDLGRWLFSTVHIRLEYAIVYDDQDIERLSPGTRGIVLLTLYLSIDEWDRRPLLIDQPEENLDPKSVFDELVAYFREARTRRQVILVTHNANLVVNTDADQVIVASAERLQPTGLPRLSYRAGGLEDPAIRREVCSLLEGGERAFLERERRYRLVADRRG